MHHDIDIFYGKIIHWNDELKNYWSFDLLWHFFVHTFWIELLKSHVRCKETTFNMQIIINILIICLICPTVYFQCKKIRLHSFWGWKTIYFILFHYFISDNQFHSFRTLVHFLKSQIWVVMAKFELCKIHCRFSLACKQSIHQILVADHL